MLRKLTVLFIAWIGLNTLGCSSVGKIPWITMWEPKHFARDLASSTSVDASIEARAKVPLVLPAYVTVDFLRDRAVVRIRPPFNTAELQDYYRQELTQRGYTQVDFPATGKE